MLAPVLAQDRPNTLEWIIKYNIWPGEIMIVFFAHLFLPSGQRDLVYIIVFVTGVGDGLAEPVCVPCSMYCVESGYARLFFVGAGKRRSF